MTRRIRSVTTVLAVAALAPLTTPGIAVAGTSTGTSTTAGAPGALSHFDLARKDCFGTARETGSKVWYTVAGGVLSDVYSPTVDTTNVETLRFAVTDGRTFTDLQGRDTTYTIRALDRTGMACEVTSTARDGRYRIVTDYVTDPARDSVVMRVRLQPLARTAGDLRLYVRYDASVNGNGGGGPDNGGADDATVDPATTALVSSDTDTLTNAVNRDYAVPLHAALRADRPFPETGSGYAGTSSDGLSQLDTARRLAAAVPDAPHGNVVQTARVDLDPAGGATLALGFGTDRETAVRTAGASATTPFPLTYRRYVAGWLAYDATLRPPAARLPGLSGARVARLHAAYWLSANVLKASEDKTFPGAVVAAVASPWGQAVSAGDSPGGRAVYFGSYREVFSRDLYEAFTGLLATGDLATARDTVRFLFERQQLPDGRFPRNSLVNGRKAPDTGGDQLDESAYPILMALQAGLDGDPVLWPRIRRAADFVVAHGPSFGAERWEEQGGFSPSTIAAQIAGLVAAGRIADRNGDHASARVYRATADHFQRAVKGWTVTTSGPYADGRYFLRLSRTGDPDAANSYNLGNGSVVADQRAVVDAGFLELTRLGALPADDRDVVRSLAIVDTVIRRETPSGSGFYRYGTSTPGTEDGYGDCFEPDATSCAPSGKPWPTGNNGSGHLWPVLSGERAEQQLQTGDVHGAAAQLAAMDAFSSGVGLVPEQAWENPAEPAAPFGADPTTASIGYTAGGPAGSAAPLTWAQAGLARLVQGLGAGRPVEQPAAVRDRYVDHSPPPAVELAVTAPADGAAVTAATTAVIGRTEAGATVDIAATPTDTGGEGTVRTTVAGADGRFSVEVPTPFGTTVLTVAATAGSGGTASGGTGYARRAVVSDAVSGTVLLDATDPDGDDTGPDTYAYPTSADFVPGAFDVERFQVVDAGDQVFLRVRTRDLTPTFGSPIGAQLLDVYVHVPGAAATSTLSAHPLRNYTVAPDSAWSRLIEVQGFLDPTFVDATGAALGPVSVLSSQVSRFITVAVPKAALGQPGPGWVFTVVLHGQDGFSPDQARGFAPTPQPFLFGLCAPGGTSPVCATDPALAPKVMDTLTPSGVDQSAELDPTRGPAVLHGISIG